MEVSRSRFYQYLKSTKRRFFNNDLILHHHVKILARQSKQSYGSRKMSIALKQMGYQVGRYKARTLMQNAGVFCVQRRHFKVTTKSNPSHQVVENKLNRQFRAESPNKVWVADISYLRTSEGWLYVACVLDLFSRRIVGWAMDNNMRTSLVEKALSMALGRRKNINGLMHHSDRGSQYTCHNFQSLLSRSNITVSMSRKGNCWDNAVMERFWGSLKSERTDHKKYKTRKEAKNDVIDYVEMFYNSKRIHATLGYVSPLQFENQFIRKNVSTIT